MGVSTGSGYVLRPNTSSAETQNDLYVPNATGFTAARASSTTYIYMAIRRPMKVPTDATTVFSPQTATYSSNQVVTTGFPVDLTMLMGRTVALTTYVQDRLRGLASTNTTPIDPVLATQTTDAERTDLGLINTVYNTSYQISPGYSGFASVNWNFSRRPGFFDEVCYTGTGSATTQAHNLGVAPELIIVKSRSSNSGAHWVVYAQPIGNTKYLYLDATIAADTFNVWNNTNPTSSVFSISTNYQVNNSGTTFVAYLFATCAGVSKVGSYTGTGASQTINCGFTGGARFVLIKRTDSTGNWYVWDTARGMVSGTDPSLSLNTTSAESNANSVYTATTGFSLLASPSADVNTSGGSYIFLAIA
jgi:hypothetical protein